MTEFKVIQVKDNNRWMTYRRRGTREYLWPDGTIHSTLVAATNVDEEAPEYLDSPGFFFTESVADAVLAKYQREHK